MQPRGNHKDLSWCKGVGVTYLAEVLYIQLILY